MDPEKSIKLGLEIGVTLVTATFTWIAGLWAGEKLVQGAGAAGQYVGQKIAQRKQAQAQAHPQVQP